MSGVTDNYPSIEHSYSYQITISLLMDVVDLHQQKACELKVYCLELDKNVKKNDAT